MLYFGEMLIHVKMDHGSRCWKLKHSLLTRSSNCRVVMRIEDLIWIPVPRELLVVSKNVLSGHIGFCGSKDWDSSKSSMGIWIPLLCSIGFVVYLRHFLIAVTFTRYCLNVLISELLSRVMICKIY